MGRVVVGTPGYTREEIREFVHEYHLQAHGTKGAWLARQSFSPHQFKRWRRALFEGDLDRNLIPREHGGMARTRGEWTAFERARAKELAEHESEVEQLKKRIHELEGTNDALGKAIGLLHELNVSEPDAKTTSGADDSSRRRTDSSES
jgi:transposase-like protein